MAGASAGPPHVASEAFAEQVRDALQHLFDPVALQTHPLGRFADEAPGGLAGDRARVRRGQALRTRIEEGIEALKPSGPASSATADRAERGYRLLRLRYVEALDPLEVRRQLGLSKTQYYVAHRQAVDALTSLLAERWQQAEADQTAAEQAPLAEQKPPPASTRAVVAAQREPRAGKPLPRPLTRFIGRQRELQALLGLLRGDAASGAIGEPVRLLTLTGPAGTGKTRLALQVALSVAGAGGDVTFVELGTLHDPDLVLPAIGQQIGIRETAERPLLEAIQDALLERPVLLVLDNFEQISAAAPVVGGLLKACNQLQVMVTSRVPLSLYGERVFPVGPLSLAPKNGALSPETLLQSEAAQLFLECARAVRPDYSITEDTAPDVAVLCRRLDGLPLAVELAAARTAVLPVRTIVERLDRRLSLLVGAVDLPDRQQTLRAAIEWSYDLLSAHQQAVFRRLAVFSGGWSLEAAEAVLEAALATEDQDVLDTLLALARQSLLRQETNDGEPRFTMLETIHAYALERLRAADEQTAYRERHARYFAGWVVRIEPLLGGAEPAPWLAKLAEEHDNIRAAVRWTIEQGEAAVGLRLVGALRQFWFTQGYWSEGRQWLTNLLALEPGALDATRAKALDRASALARFQGDFAAARALGRESLSLWRALGDEGGAAAALLGLGYIAVSQLEYEEAWRLFRECADTRRALGDRRGEADALAHLSVVRYLEGEYDEARTIQDECLAARRALGDRSGIAHSLNLMGCISRCQGAYEEAQDYLEESLALCEALGHRPGAATVRENLGHVALARGELAEATGQYHTSLVAFRALDDRRGVAWCLQGLVGVAALQGNAERAARLAGAAEALATVSGAQQPPADRDAYARHVAHVRETLGERRFTQLLASGRIMSLDQAVAYALQDS